MAAAGQYTNCAIDVNGQRLLQASDVEITRHTNSIEQNTLALGWAGESPGASRIDIKVTNGVPSAGMEYDAGPSIRTLGLVPITVHLDDGSFLTTQGIVQSDNFKKAVNSNASYEVTFKAQMADWQR